MNVLMDWIAKGKVRVAWQIIFSFIPGVLIWSFFRIKKLRLFLVMMAGPAVATIYILPLIIVGPQYYEECDLSFFSLISNESCMIEALIIPSIVVNVIYHGFKTYFIIKWTRKWNQSFQVSKESEN